MTADSSETPTPTAGATADLTLDASVAAADVPPALVAGSLGQYLRASWLRVRSGDSGVLPVILGLVVVAVAFQIANSKFLSALNLVNLFEQSTVYMLLAMAEIFALLLGEIDLSVGIGNTQYGNEKALYDIYWGSFSPVVGWVLLVVLVAAAGTGLWMRDARKRRRGLVAAPRSLIVMKIALIAVAGIAVVAVSNVNRAHTGVIEGVPFVIPIVLIVLGACTVLLQRTKFGRYVYAIGGSAEAAQRAGIRVTSIRTWCFVLAAVISGIAGVLFASWQVSLTTNIIKASNSYVLLAVAAALIDTLSRRGAPDRT